MAALFTGPALIDLVIALSLLETAFLLAHHRMTGRGIAPSQFLANMVSGLCLMLALRGALTQSGWEWVAMPLVAAGIAHASDLWHRWQRPGRQAAGVSRDRD